MSTAKVFRPTILMESESFEAMEPTISRQICRNLFGPIDHDQLRSDIRSELAKIDTEKCKKWNFDYVNFRPLDGPFMWQRVGEPKTSGSPTIACEIETDTTSQSGSSVVERNTREHVSSNNVGSDIGTGTREPTNTKETCMTTPDHNTTRRRSARITDYLRRGKKTSRTARKIKFVGDTAGESVVLAHKRVQARKLHHRGRVNCKQSRIDEFLPKLRPRHPTGKVASM